MMNLKNNLAKNEFTRRLVIYLSEILFMKSSVAHQSKAEYLIDKGMEILWSKGYNATSVNDIVKAAEVPKGSFYFYFKSKEDFAVKAIEEYFDRQLSIIDKILGDASKSPKTRIIEFHEYRINELKNNVNCSGCMACNLGSEMAEHSESIRLAINNKETQYKNKVIEVMQEAQRLGEIDADMDVKGVVEFLEDAGKGAMITMKEQDNTLPIDNFYRILRTYFLK